MNVTIDLLHPLVMLFTGGVVGITAYKWLNRDVYFDDSNGLGPFIFIILVVGGLVAAILHFFTGGA